MVSLRGSKFGSRVAMACTHHATHTRPGPPAGLPNPARFAHFTNPNRGGAHHNFRWIQHTSNNVDNQPAQYYRLLLSMAFYPTTLLSDSTISCSVLNLRTGSPINKHNSPFFTLTSCHIISCSSITFSSAKWRLSDPMWGPGSFHFEGKSGHFGLCCGMLF